MRFRFFPAALLGLLAATPARAYVRAVTATGAPWHWDRPVVTLKVYAGTPVPELTSDELVGAAAGAAAPWSQPQLACTSVALTVEGIPEATAPVKRDGVNRLVFRRDQWCPDPREPGEPCHSPLTLALTTNVVEVGTGRILEADIEVNAVDYLWSDLVLRPGAVPHAHDLQNALTHELGHLLGFAHTCRLTPDDPAFLDDMGRPTVFCSEASPEALASTLRPDSSETDLDRRTLTEDDQRGVCDVYPRSITQGQTGVETGGCDAGGRGPPPPVLVLVLVLVLGRRLGILKAARSTSTNPGTNARSGAMGSRDYRRTVP